MGQSVYLSEGILLSEDGTLVDIEGTETGNAAAISDVSDALDDHVADATAAHAATAISVDPEGDLVGTDLQTVLQELRDRIAAVEP